MAGVFLVIMSRPRGVTPTLALRVSAWRDSSFTTPTWPGVADEPRWGCVVRLDRRHLAGDEARLGLDGTAPPSSALDGHVDRAFGRLRGGVRPAEATEAVAPSFGSTASGGPISAVVPRRQAASN